MRDWLIRRRGYEYLAAPLVALLALCAAFAGRGIYPFGNLSVAIWDMDIQYVGLFGWLSNVLRGQGSLAYSWGAGMGEGMAATFAYYLSSPFNLLAGLFDAGDAPRLLSWLTLLKLSCASLTCYSFLRARHRPGTVHVLLGACYACCGWAVAQCSNIMWLDGLIMLPLVVLGVWRLVNKGSCLTLFFSVAGAVVFNWYSGYMDCVFAVAYFFALWLALPRGQRRVSCGLRFGATMLLGVGASAALFLPAVLGLLGTKEGGASMSDGFLRLSMACNPMKVAGGLCVSATPSSDWDVTPALYSGELATVLAGAYLLDSRSPRRDRVCGGALLAFMAVSMCFLPLDVMWSSFKPATSYFFRYSYVFSFVLVILAARGWAALRGRDDAARRRLARRGALAGAAVAGAGIAAYAAYKHGLLVEPWAVAATFALLAAYAVLAPRAVAPAAKKDAGRGAHAALLAIAVLVVAELGVNAWSVFGHYGRDADDWGSYIGSLQAACDEVPSGDAGLRMARVGVSFRDHVTTTESFVAGLTGPSEYTSTMGAPMADLFSRLGYCGTNEVFGYYSNSAMKLSDSLLGIQFTMAPEDSMDGQPAATAEVGGRPVGIWENDSAMPFAYGIRAGAGGNVWPEASFSCTDLLEKTGFRDQWNGYALVKDPFSNQEAMLGDMCGQDASSVYRSAKIEESEGAEAAGERTWRVTTAVDGSLYLYLPVISAVRQSMNVYVNGSFASSVGNNFDAGAMLLGSFTAGETIEVTVRPSGRPSYTVSGRSAEELAHEALFGPETDDAIVAASLDEPEFERLRGMLDAKAAQVTDFDDGHVALSCSAGEAQTLFTAIPYDAGWHATVDGAPAEIRCLYGGVCGIDLGAGEHTVEFSYETPGLGAGLAATAASIAAFALWRAGEKRRSRRS